MQLTVKKKSHLMCFKILPVKKHIVWKIVQQSLMDVMVINYNKATKSFQVF